jgi:hypothetical protein
MEEGETMIAWKTLAGLTLALLVVALDGAVQAQTYPLAENVRPGDCFRIQLDMKLDGELKVNKDGKVLPLKLIATAAHEFPERVLSVAAGGLTEKTARVYEKAQAVIGVGGDRSERGLRKDRRLIVAQRSKDQLLVYSPAGGLVREELELTSEHFDTLCLTGLLPGKTVAAGETWKVSNAVAQALCLFEGLTEQDLSCKLEEVKDGVARIGITGSANGIELGALVKLTVQATARFDLTSKRLTGLDWQQKDEREQGPANPATSVQTTYVLKRAPIEQPACLDDVSLVSVPDNLQPPPSLVNLEYHDPKGRFELLHARDWQLVSQTDEHAVLRLMERGDFVAQVTLTPWTTAGKGKHMTPDEFREAMMRTPGWEPEKELQAGEVPAGGDGRWIYRLSALGQMDGTAVLQNFYVVAGPDGEQVVLLFTMTPKKAEKLGERDLTFAASVDFASTHKEDGKPKQP